jgi:hypothetical protein
MGNMGNIKKVLVAVTLGLGLSAQAQEGSIAPAWFGSDWMFVSTDLSNTKQAPAQTNGILTLVGADEGFSSRKKQQLEDMNRTYELRSNYGLLSQEEEASHQAQMASYSESLAVELKDLYLKGLNKKLLILTQNARGLGFISKPLVVLVAAYSVLYRGQALKLNLTDASSLTLRANLPNKSSQVELLNNVVNSSVSVQGGQVNAGVSKGISNLGINLNLAYGLKSKDIRSSVSKQIVGGLSGVVESQRSGQSTASEETAKLQLAINL